MMQGHLVLAVEMYCLGCDNLVILGLTEADEYELCYGNWNFSC